MLSLQRTYYCCHILIVVGFVIFLSACAERGARTPSGGTAPYQGPGIPAVSGPSIRVGLTTDAVSSAISAKPPLYFSDGGRSSGINSPITAALSSVSEVVVRYSVQVGSYSTRENAAMAQQEMKSKINENSFIFENPDRKVFQLRLGPYPSKERAQQAVQEMKDNGYPGTFYVAENAGTGKQPDLLLKDELGNVILRTRKKATIWSEEGNFSLNGTSYRGHAVVFVNATGRLTVVNVLNLEDYLKGVVPNEIPSSSSENYEAVKAQSVAARTYAYKNLNQFESEGFDICASPRCQVYSGVSTEKVLSNKAIEETRGEILTYEGSPINALYTSTCGGRTENVEIMFEDWHDPYLRGVECYPEESKSQKSTASIRGKAQPWWFAWLSLKIEEELPGNLNQPIRIEEVVALTDSVLKYLGKASCLSSDFSKPDWIQTGNYLVQRLCWEKKRDSLLIEKDYQYFLSHLNIRNARSSELSSFLFLFHDGIMVPENLDAFNADTDMTRAQFFETLYNILDHYHQVIPAKGMVRELHESEIQVVDDTGVHTYPYQDTISLYQISGDRRVPRDLLGCSPGDQVEFAVKEGRMKVLGCELSSSGGSMDRSSKYSFWQETYTPAELGEKVSKYLDVGDIIDLEPLSYGPSDRVYEMKIIGTKGSGIVKGIRVRWALGLKENLFVIDRIVDQNGKIKEFVFTGRGWGHGVGMCQIGALGYAKMGMDYRAILQHYYTNVQITKAH